MNAAAELARFAARLASAIGTSGMRALAQFNKHVTNHIVRLWAGRVPHMAVIEHIGRRSGRTFKTPVMVFRSGQSVSVVLNYGVHSDWVQNVLEAGQARVEHRGRHYRLHSPELVAGDDDESPLPSGRRSATILRASIDTEKAPI
ncbi:nitroreductase family deazaflavin-dependent oxidoreductase [Williamsia muralis]|uniref:nitroreductase family deazaflavin-dependent oxidoreductase n=1 Tax=Williamsia marianensis TaxID=85044 RepID=UPI0037FACA1E